MAAVKIIFDPPALSWPLSFLFVFSISCTSISPLSHNSLCHSLWDRERLQHAGLGRHNPDKNPPCRTSPNLTHEPTTHIYWARTTSDPIWSLSSRIWPILALSFRGARPNRAEDGRQERLSLPGYLTPFIFVFVFFFWATAAKRHSHYLSSTCKHRWHIGSASVYSDKNTNWRPLVKVINVASVREGQETQPLPEMCEHFKLGTSLETAARRQIIDDLFISDLWVRLSWIVSFVFTLLQFYTWIKLLY